jgi:hypothetical protein
MLFMKIIAVYYENHDSQRFIMQTKRSVFKKQVVHKITIVLYGVKRISYTHNYHYLLPLHILPFNNTYHFNIRNIKRKKFLL